MLNLRMALFGLFCVLLVAIGFFLLRACVFSLPYFGTIMENCPRTYILSNSEVDSYQALRREEQSLRVALSFARQCKTQICKDRGIVQPIDIYFMLTMHPNSQDDLPNVAATLTDLKKRIDESELPDDFRVGLGASTDGSWVLPTGRTQADMENLSKIGSPIEKQLKMLTLFEQKNTSRCWGPNPDDCQMREERQLSSLIEIAGRKAELGFREGARQIVVLITDEPYLYYEMFIGKNVSMREEDGIADNGLVLNNDEKAPEGPPTVKQTAEIVGRAGISVIFAVTAEQVPNYIKLAAHFNNARVFELNSDAKNLASVVVEGVEAICN